MSTIMEIALLMNHLGSDTEDIVQELNGLINVFIENFDNIEFEDLTSRTTPRPRP